MMRCPTKNLAVFTFIDTKKTDIQANYIDLSINKQSNINRRGEVIL